MVEFLNNFGGPANLFIFLWKELYNFSLSFQLQMKIKFLSFDAHLENYALISFLSLDAHH